MLKAYSNQHTSECKKNYYVQFMVLLFYFISSDIKFINFNILKELRRITSQLYLFISFQTALDDFAVLTIAIHIPGKYTFAGVQKCKMFSGLTVKFLVTFISIQNWLKAFFEQQREANL